MPDSQEVILILTLQGEHLLTENISEEVAELLLNARGLGVEKVGVSGPHGDADEWYWIPS